VAFRQLANLDSAFLVGGFVSKKRQIGDGARRMQLFGRTGVNLVVQSPPQRMVRRKDHTVCLVYPARSVKPRKAAVRGLLTNGRRN
jgi:hypothetical protein